MTPHVSHHEAFVALGAAAVGALDAAERDAILAHVAECEECRTEFDALNGAIANLAFAAPLAADSSTGSRGRIRERLGARATAEAQARRLASPPLVFPKPVDEATATPSRVRASIEPPRRHSAEWAALVASVLFVVTLGMLAVTWRDRENLRASLTTQTTKTNGSAHAADSLHSLLTARDSLVAGITGRDVVAMTLTSRVAREAYARVFWDRSHSRWTMVAHNMPALEPGRTYQLWLITSKATVSAGTFDPAADSGAGAGVVRATYAMTSESLRGLAVTDEPAGGVPQPTGATVVSFANAR